MTSPVRLTVTENANKQPVLILPTEVYTQDNGEKMHDIHVELAGPGLCIVLDPQAETEGQSANLIIEKQEIPGAPRRFVIMVHGDAGDPACRIELYKDKLRIFREDGNYDLLHEYDRYNQPDTTGSQLDPAPLLP